MSTTRSRDSIRIFVAVSFLCMIVVNILANALPLNNLNTGQVSDSYPNLFAPTALTFAIWGLIYLLLALHTLHQFGLMKRDRSEARQRLLDRIALYFGVSSIINAAWIFSWHYKAIPLSVLLMLALLICLILIVHTIGKQKLTLSEQFWIRLPFSIYFGWITVATIANITVLLVDLKWDGFGLPDAYWAFLIVAVGAVIGTVTMLKNRDYAYGLVLVWAYVGILIKHLSPTGFNGQYPAVIAVTIACIALIVAAGVYGAYRIKQRDKAPAR